MRSRRQLFFAILILMSAAGVTFGGLLFSAKKEPTFYCLANHSDDWDTHERSARLLTRVLDLQNDIRAKNEWGDTFTVDDLNAFFIEHLGPKGRLTEALPKGFHSPRIAIDGDRLKIGVKYGEGFWSTVVWVELRVWLVAEETNLAAVEVCNLKAGGLPFGSQSILDKMADIARDSSIDVTWYRNKSNPVGVFRFFAKQPQVTSQVLTLEVKDGRIMIAGRSFQDSPPVTPLATNPAVMP
ncbi:hypothetical protein [Frigoriglobus tundricola]|uniref:Uncharacterized protein n=1 Tax=Frigoriglobus tundricola TaxID=2774151 RepID=A0A6M5YJD4_9BACT|nr:hypothetical protein [Frigoriglobus tundricola]QJW93383.1 hypothetical protein FTUN_0889 [Frigoriglobus tundricola]